MRARHAPLTAKFAENLSDDARLGGFERRQIVSVFECGEALLDFAVEREAAGLRLREDQFAMNQHIELTALAGSDYHVLAKLGFQ